MLEDQLEKYIEKNKNCNFGMFLDIIDGLTYSYNADNQFETASCIKVFILVALYHEVMENHLKITDTMEYKKQMRTAGSGIIKSMEPGLVMSLKNYAILMIALSDNTATNMLVNKIGGVKKVNTIIKSLGFEKTELLNYIQFEKTSTVGLTTPKEFAKVFRMIYEEKVWNRELSKEMYSILRRQQCNDALCKFLPFYDVACRGTGEGSINSVASKSGSLSFPYMDLDNVCNDGGIISTSKGDYIIAMFSSGFEDPNISYDNDQLEFMAHINEKVYKSIMNKK